MTNPAANHPVIHALVESVDSAAAAYAQERNDFTRARLASAEARLFSVARQLGLA